MFKLDITFKQKSRLKCSIPGFRKGKSHKKKNLNRHFPTSPFIILTLANHQQQGSFSFALE